MSKTFTGALTLRSADGKIHNFEDVEMVISGLSAADDRIDVVDEGGKVVAMIANRSTTWRDVTSEPLQVITRPAPTLSLASFFMPSPTPPPPNRAQRRAKRRT